MMATRVFILATLLAVAAAQDCALPSTTYLAANSKTVVHGLFDPSIPPVAHVRSGDTLVAECVSTNANSDYAKMVKGDPGVEDIFYWPNGVPRLNKSTPQYPNSGGHFLTGPVRICGALPGDVLKIEILDVKPRVNPSTGRTFGANFQGRSYTQSYIGTRYGDYNFSATNATTIVYEVIKDAYGDWAQPVYQFTTPQYIAPDGRAGGVAMIPHTQNIGIAAGNYTPSNGEDPRTFPSFENVTYPDGYQSALNQSGPIQYQTGPKLNWRVPLRQHFGVLAVTPKDAKNWERTGPPGSLGAGSGPPSKFGGNIDNWRMGKGITVYLKVQVPDALWTFGDCHAAEGDGETSSSAIESSNTGTFRFTLIKEAELPKGLASLKGPLYEFEDSFSLQGFSYMDYLNEGTWTLYQGTYFCWGEIGCCGEKGGQQGRSRGGGTRGKVAFPGGRAGLLGRLKRMERVRGRGEGEGGEHDGLKSPWEMRFLTKGGTGMEARREAKRRRGVGGFIAGPAPGAERDRQSQLGEHLNKPMARDFLAFQGFLNPIQKLGEPLPVPSAIGNRSLGEDLNKPMANCYKATRDFLMDSFDLEERETLALMSVGVDFGITEVVDGNWGVHSFIKKSFFSRRFTADQGPMSVGGSIASARKLRTFQDLPDSDSIFRPDLLDLLKAYEEDDVSFNWSA
ncbi:acetamidase/formamidase [Klebsormidium nitens]|uniref:Acetamidase/formamidase n=1 Tax=Klebsormidium nitens TaxID=105231 RepID=A0A1Y1HIK5_KLENI|nr:acetamidase/formamidase [Klebsormidium nitens]|eukprot:GAQ78330.1 acetamidase/formamidase [Klebsormidium nitens]